MSKSASAGAKRETTNSQTGVDPVTMAYMQEIMNAARAAGQAGPSPLTTGASGYNTGLMDAGTKGLAALGGDKAALGGLMDPYQSQVVDATNAQWNQADMRAQMGVNDAATKSLAFGGGRHGVAAGVTQGENNRNRTSQIGGLLSTGYNDAMGRAGQMAGMGFAGAGANANLGMGGVGSPQQWLLQMLNQGFRGPTGQTSSGATAGTQFGTTVGTKPW